MPMHKHYIVLLGGLLLAACSASDTAGPSTSATALTATTAPALTPIPTPAPVLVLIAEGEPQLAERLRQWAAGRGWGMQLVNAQEAASGLDDPQVDPQLVVSMGVPIDFELAAPAVLVEVEGANPQEQLSTVGTPATHHGQAGFLAGLLAGLTTRVEWVGLVTDSGAQQEADLLAGFQQGLKVGCPRCRLVGLSLSEATVDGFRGRGVDVVFAPPGVEAVPLAASLAEAGVWLVWVGDPPAEIGPEALAGRVEFEHEALLFRALDGLAAGEAGQAWPYTVANGGLTLADVNPQAISPGRQRLLDESYQAVASGELDIGLDGP